MQSGIHVAHPPPKTLMIFDGDCNFCTLWIRRWQQMTGDTVDYLPSQDPRIPAQFPEIPGGQFANSVQVIECDGAVYSGAEGVFRSLAQNPNYRWPLRCYEKSKVLADSSEHAYRFVAKHRTFFSWLTRWFYGQHVEKPAHLLTRWLFLRVLGGIYLIAFISLWTQISGLIGHNGILPTDQFMSAMREERDAHHIGLERFHLLPTLSWFDSSDGLLHLQCAGGVALAVMLITGIAPAPCLALLWLLYLSLATVARDFLGFQWDNLLLETGFLAVFFAPLQLLPGILREAPPSRIMLWLLRLLLFKLMFSSGAVKWLSGDPNWHNFTALTFHYQTQPLPTWIAWHAHQLPAGFQKISCVVLFVIELGAPFLIFMPRRSRFCGCVALAVLQILILLTGNYTFFNCLTLALCLLLLDDFVLIKTIPRKLRLILFSPSRVTSPGQPRHWPRAVILVVAVGIFGSSLFMMAITLGLRTPLLAPLGFVAGELAPFRTVNNYGLFAVMTTTRNEIIVEGSDDRLNWRAYEFKYKPGDLQCRPAFIAPFQPRLDWQMWFAALGDYRQNPWFVNFCERLLQGSPEVLDLLKKKSVSRQAATLHPGRAL